MQNAPLKKSSIRKSSTQKSKTRLSRPAADIDPYVQNLLKFVLKGKDAMQFEKGVSIFSQGDKADAIYFVQTGKVKITVVSSQGKEAVLAISGPHEFFGEGCLVGQPFRISTATTTESSSVFRVGKQGMLQALHAQPELAEKFTAALLTRNISLEEDLCDQLFNHSEKRLARVLLKLSRFGHHAGVPESKMPRMTHETLAEMVGTTRSRVTFFINKFKKLGLIEYTGTGEILVRDEMMTDIVLHD